MSSPAGDGPIHDERGSGPAVVFSHGTVFDRSMFAPQLEALAGEYRVVAYDQRSCTACWDDDYTLADLADDCVQLLDGLEIERCVLVGTSIGGFIALEVALAHPQRLAGLVVISARAGPYSDDERTRFASTFGQLDHEGEVPAEFAEWLAALIFADVTHDRQPELVRHWTERWCTRPGRAVYREWRAWIDKKDRRSQVSAVTVPTLLVYGKDDRMLSLDRISAITDAMPDVRAAAIPRAGHVPNVENATAVNAELRAFLDDVYGATKRPP